MAINKSNTSLGVKIVLVFLIVAFVVGFIPIVGSLFGGGRTTDTQTTGTDAISQAGAQYRPQVESLTAMLQSDPESYTVLIQLGNAYFDWALGLQGLAQTNQQASGADQPLWIAAKDAYSRAVAISPGEPPVQVDYAITIFYSGDTNQAIAIAEKVTKDNPTFAPAWFNLGIFYGAIGQNDKGIAALEKYLELDPKGQAGDPKFAKSQIATLKGGTPGKAPTTTTP